MTEAASSDVSREAASNRRLAVLLAMAMFVLAGLVGFLNSFRMMRLPDPEPTASVEGMALG
jgi:hydrogenase/urease accessory protein HupE